MEKKLHIFVIVSAPEYVLCLQNGKFDKPDRMFNRYYDEMDVMYFINLFPSEPLFKV